MELPEQYKNLSIDEKRVVVINLMTKFGNENIQSLIDNLSDDQVEFLFKYFFTESKEEREKMWHNMQKKYEDAMKEVENIFKRIHNINLKYGELLQQNNDSDDLQQLDNNIQKL